MLGLALAVGGRVRVRVRTSPRSPDPPISPITVLTYTRSSSAPVPYTVVATDRVLGAWIDEIVVVLVAHRLQNAYVIAKPVTLIPPNTCTTSDAVV